MIQWRIYTQNINHANTLRLASAFFANSSMTVYSVLGMYEGAVEQSLVIEFIGVGEDEERINSLARSIKTVNNQKAVLVTATKLIGHKLI